MGDHWQEYVNDPRSICKYGTKCYQKNPEHLKNYKHPPVLYKQKYKRNIKRYSPYNRNKGQESPNTSIDIVDTDTKAPSVKKDDVKKEESLIKKDDQISIELPEDLSFYDKNTDKSFFKELFLVEMPDDFFKFFEFLSDMEKSPEETLGAVNLELIGPYDLLLGKLPILENKELYLIHWRFFYDPPEYQAVLKKKKSEYHIGYYRDTPEQSTALVGSSDSSKDHQIKLMSDNIFGAVYSYLQNEKKSSLFAGVPSQKLMDKIKTYSEKNGISLAEFSMKKRISETVTKTFHGAGIVVPYNKKTQVGYRRLAETDGNLKKMFANLQKATTQEEKDKYFSELQEVITNASIAIDECDFGTGLELAIALFCSGLKDLHSMALSNFTAAYGVLSREPFARIAEAHLKYRRAGPNMSLLNKDI